MSRIRKRVVALVAVAVLLSVALTASGLYSRSLRGLLSPAATKAQAYKPLSTVVDTADPARFTQADPLAGRAQKMAETETLILYAAPDNKSIKVCDKATGIIWSSSVDDPAVLESGLTDYYYNSMTSLFAFDYIDLTDMLSKPTAAYSSAMDARITREVIPCGFRLTYRFPAVYLSVSLDFTLAGDALEIRVPQERLEEKASNLDIINEARSDISDDISRIQTLIDKLQKRLSKEKLSSAVAMVVEMTVTALQKNLTTIQQRAGTIGFNTSVLDELTNNVRTIGDYVDTDAGMESLIEEIEAVVETVRNNTRLLMDNQACGITEISVAPYFGSADSNTEGYAFYPDRNGAISYYNRPHPLTGGNYLQDVYDEFSPTVPVRNIDESQVYTGVDVPYIYPARLPVFGSKQRDSAFVAVLTDGDKNASIAYNIATRDVDQANVACRFYTRQKSTYAAENGSQYHTYDRNRIAGDLAVRYLFLRGEKADYSGMAVAYRTLLEENGLLVKSARAQGAMPLSVEYYMGKVGDQRTLLRNYIRMTGFDDVRETAQRLREGGVAAQFVNLVSWTKNAGTKVNDRSGPAGELGGKRALEELAADMKENGDLLALSVPAVWEDKKSVNFLKAGVVTMKALNNQSPVYYDTYMLNPFFQYNDLTGSLVPALAKYGAGGVTYDALGSALYFDYNSGGRADRRKTAELFNGILKTGKETVPYASAYNPTAIHLDVLDWIQYLPQSDSRFLFTDENVPFYQMVVHGSIPYSGSNLNESPDSAAAVLKMAEYGYLPYYELTAESPLKLKNEQFYEGKYSTQASAWVPSIIDTYTEYARKAGALWTARMEKHERIAEGVSRIRYDDGSVMYVNYTGAEAADGAVRIPARDYIVVKEG